MSSAAILGGNPVLPFQARLLRTKAWIRAVFGGYGSGKTTAAALCVLAHAMRNPWRPEYGRSFPTTVVTGLTWRVLRDSGEAALKEIIPQQAIARRWVAEKRWRLINGHEILFYSLARGALLEGLDVTALWVDEVHKIRPDAWPNLQTRVRDPLAVSKLLIVSGLPVAGWLQTTFDKPEHRRDPQRHTEFASTHGNTYLQREIIEQLEASIGADEATSKLGGRWLSVEGAVYKCFDERVHLLEDHGDRAQPADMSFDVGERAAIGVLQERPFKLQVSGDGATVRGADGRRVHFVDEFIPPDGTSSEDACLAVRARGWRVKRVFIDPKSSIDQANAVRRALGEVEIIRKQKGRYGYLVEDGIEAVKTALRSTTGAVGLTFSSRLPRTKRSILTAMANYRWRDNGAEVFKDHVLDHAADIVRMPVVHLLPLRDTGPSLQIVSSA